jgi:predicted SAM-dependent methyltransferase
MNFVYRNHHQPRFQDAKGQTIVLGAGEKPYPGSTNVDFRAVPGIDIVQDLNERNWAKIPSSTYDTIIAEHIIEHAFDRLWFLDECRRIAKPGGLLILEVPHYKHIYAHSMLDHRWTFTHQSFDETYVIRGKFRKQRVEYRLFTDKDVWLRWERLGRFLAKHTNLVSGLRFYIQVIK